MAVTITKPAVNIREKLSQLERPIGINGASLMATNTPQDAMGILGVGNRNLVINGAMNVDQRNSGVANTITVGISVLYAPDRWFAQNVNGSSTYTVERSSVSPPPGFSNSLLVTTTSAAAVSATDSKHISQYIEGLNTIPLAFGTSSAKSFTISFWVKSSLTGSFGVGFANGAGNRSYVSQYSINSANTWEYKSITVPGDTSGTWTTDNTAGLRVGFNLGSGSNFNGTLNTWGTAGAGRGAFSGVTAPLTVSGATWQISGVQIEIGKTATPFEYRSYTQELALCQRYYQLIGKTSSTNDVFASGFVDGTSFYGGGFLKQTMRTAPAVSYTGNIGDLNYTHPSASFTVNSIASYQSNPDSYVIRLTSATSGTTGYGAYARSVTSSTAITFSAEL
jgi:hypothetical protein